MGVEEADEAYDLSNEIELRHAEDDPLAVLHVHVDPNLNRLRGDARQSPWGRSTVVIPEYYTEMRCIVLGTILGFSPAARVMEGMSEGSGSGSAQT